MKMQMFLVLIVTFLLSSCNDDDVITPTSFEAEAFSDVAYANTSSAQIMDIQIPEGEGQPPFRIYSCFDPLIHRPFQAV